MNLYLLKKNKSIAIKILSNHLIFTQFQDTDKSKTTNDEPLTYDPNGSTPVPSQLENYKKMEKNFSKVQTPPRSGPHLEFAQNSNSNAQNDPGLSPPKFQLNSSPSNLRIINQPDESDNRFTPTRPRQPTQQEVQPCDVQFNSPRMSVNSLNQNMNKVDEYKYNYDPRYGGNDPAMKQRNNSNSSGATAINSHIKMAKNTEQQQQTPFFNDLYNNANNPGSKNVMPIFIDDLEEETILDVIFDISLLNIWHDFFLSEHFNNIIITHSI